MNEQVVVSPIDFSQTSLSGTYNPFYAKVIDNLFTREDCVRLLDLAASKEGGWKPAGVAAGGAGLSVHTDLRNSETIRVTDEEHAYWIYEKLKPYVDELHEISPDSRWGCITNRPGKKQAESETWALTGIRTDLNFLRYGPGHYFRPHCDGLVEVGASKSFVTIHIYLNDSALASAPIMVPILDAVPAPSIEAPPAPHTVPLPQIDGSQDDDAAEQQRSSTAAAVDDECPLHGGSTRFWTPNKKAFLDVHPKLGRALLFQQRMLIHSGEEVTQGVKYTMRTDLLFTRK
ncbi:hypothetical protein H0H92_016022 [Tricholoma furcatifolium]|nr:hypothetical protein H0H92_016022 [Tricholoma furcatifolium]